MSTAQLESMTGTLTVVGRIDALGSGVQGRVAQRVGVGFLAVLRRRWPGVLHRQMTKGAYRDQLWIRSLKIDKHRLKVSNPS